MINAQIVADSKNENGNRITTFLLTYPRIIHAELLTHRAFSRNAASSRAIPFKRMCESVDTNPFVPIAFQKDHSGMQGTEYFTGLEEIACKTKWVEASESAIKHATYHNQFGITKQLANRLLEPFQWYTSLVTATDFENFFELRCPQYEVTYTNDNGNLDTVYFRSWKDLIVFHIRTLRWNRDSIESLENADTITKLKRNKGAAEIHLMALAECMWDAMNENTPKELKEGEWHIPFEDRIDLSNYETTIASGFETQGKIAISTGMCARTSYTTVGDEKEVRYSTLVGIHDKMINQRPFHASPFEHCAQVNDGKRSRNFVGFTQYREIIENGK